MYSLVALTTLVVCQIGGASPVEAFDAEVPAVQSLLGPQPGFSEAANEMSELDGLQMPSLEKAKAPKNNPVAKKTLAAIADPNVTPASATERTSESAPPWSEYVTQAEVQAKIEAEVQARVQAEVQARVADELEAQGKQFAWRKGEFTIVPYGTIWAATDFDTQRSYNGDYCLWIQSPTDHPHESDASVDAKSTRLGIDLTGPCIPCFGDAKTGGKVEVDFQGQFVTRNKPGLLLRHAYVETKNDEFRLLVGQTWDVISPLYIPTLDYTAGSGVGNLAYRRAQFRFERYFTESDTCMFTLQSSINANVITDFVTEPATTISADIGPYPDVQARGAITLGDRTNPEKPPVVIGISGHGGQQNYDFLGTSLVETNLRIPTWSLDADISVPITPKFGFQAEFFTGENLSNYMGGILQGIDRDTHNAIHATGGWANIWYKWRPNICQNFGYAVDDPANGDLKYRLSRTYNQAIFTNVLYDVTKNLQVGLEVDFWKTLYLTKEPGEAVRFECAVKYFF